MKAKLATLGIFVIAAAQSQAGTFSLVSVSYDNEFYSDISGGQPHWILQTFGYNGMGDGIVSRMVGGSIPQTSYGGPLGNVITSGGELWQFADYHFTIKYTPSNPFDTPPSASVMLETTGYGSISASSRTNGGGTAFADQNICCSMLSAAYTLFTNTSASGPGDRDDDTDAPGYETGNITYAAISLSSWAPDGFGNYVGTANSLGTGELLYEWDAEGDASNGPWADAGFALDVDVYMETRPIAVNGIPL